MGDDFVILNLDKNGKLDALEEKLMERNEAGPEYIITMGANSSLCFLCSNTPCCTLHVACVCSNSADDLVLGDATRDLLFVYNTVYNVTHKLALCLVKTASPLTHGSPVGVPGRSASSSPTAV